MPSIRPIKHGFRLVSTETKNRLLRTYWSYWSIPERQVDTSVVLADARWLALHPREAKPAQP